MKAMIGTATAAVAIRRAGIELPDRQVDSQEAEPEGRYGRDCLVRPSASAARPCAATCRRRSQPPGARARPLTRPSRSATTARSSFPTLHLGTRGCKAELLADFLARNGCETLYPRRRHRRRLAAQAALVLDRGAQPRRRRNCCTRSMSARASSIVPGNHDEVLRPYCGRDIAGIEVMQRGCPRDRRRQAAALVLHGDQFDGVIAYAQLARAAWRLGLHRRAAAERSVQRACAARSACPIGRCRPI